MLYEIRIQMKSEVRKQQRKSYTHHNHERRDDRKAAHPEDSLHTIAAWFSAFSS